MKAGDAVVLATPGAVLPGGTKIKKVSIYAEFHQFRTDFRSLDLGDEFDIGLTFPFFVKGLTGKLEYGDYPHPWLSEQVVLPGDVQESMKQA